MNHRIKVLLRLNQISNRIFKLPILLLSVTSRCNSRCLMCDIWRNEEEDLNSEQIENTIISLKKYGLDTVVITGGEPLLRNDLFDLCNEITEHNVRLVLNTNGILLEKVHKDISDRFDTVMVSLDSHDPAVYNEIRGCNGFERVVVGIRSLEGHDTRIIATHTLQKKNILGVVDYIEFTESLGVDGVSFRPVDVYSNAFGKNKNGPGNRHHLLPNRKEIEKFSALTEGTDTRYSQDLREIRDYFSAALGSGDFPDKECGMPFLGLVIESDGNVKPCFFTKPMMNLYDSKNTGIRSMINSHDFRVLRKKHKEGSVPECERCIFGYCIDL